MFNEEEPDTSGMDSAAEQAESQRHLRRLHQLADEIEQGLEREDLELVCQAASLLGPTMTQWNAVHDALPVSAGEAAQLALETRQALTRCESGLLRIMGLMTDELRRIRQGRRSMQTMHRRPVTGNLLDDLR